MSGADKSLPLTKAAARRIWLRAQRLDARAPFGEGPLAVAAAVEHLGYVQIDTINVIERCHHHILWNRIPEYRRADLRQAQSADKSVFEYWTHALSYVPSKDLRFFIPAMKRHRRGRLTLRTYKIEPAPLPKVDSKLIRDTRRRLRCSRAVFARKLRINERTLEKWEQGRSKPNPQAAALVLLVRKFPDTLDRLDRVAQR